MKRSAVMNTTLRSGWRLADAPGYGVEQMSLAEAGRRMNEQRIEVQRLTARRFGDAQRGGMGQRDWNRRQEGLEGQRMIERRAASPLRSPPDRSR